MIYFFISLLIFSFYIFYEALKKDPREIPSNLISQEIPIFSLSSLDGTNITDNELKNKQLFEELEARNGWLEGELESTQNELGEMKKSLHIVLYMDSTLN